MQVVEKQNNQETAAMQHCRFREQDREEFDLLGPPHPGEILREELLPRLSLSRKALAKQLNISNSSVSRLLNERRRVTSDLALSLAQLSGTNALYWLVLQAHHDAWLVQRASDASRSERVSTRRTERERRRQSAPKTKSATKQWISPGLDPGSTRR